MSYMGKNLPDGPLTMYLGSLLAESIEEINEAKGASHCHAQCGGGCCLHWEGLLKDRLRHYPDMHYEPYFTKQYLINARLPLKDSDTVLYGVDKLVVEVRSIHALRPHVFSVTTSKQRLTVQDVRILRRGILSNAPKGVKRSAFSLGGGNVLEIDLERQPHRTIKLIISAGYEDPLYETSKAGSDFIEFCAQPTEPDTTADTLAEILDGLKLEMLASYFQGLVIDDLKLLHPDELVEWAKPEQKAAMTKLVKTRRDLFLPTCGRDPFVLLPKDKVHHQVEFTSFQNKLLGTRFGHVTIEGKLPIRELVDFEPVHPVQGLDLSKNNLTDEDLTLVLDFVRKLPDCKVVDLSYNRLSGDNPALKAALYRDVHVLLELLGIEFIDITMTALATYDRRDFYDGLTDKHLTKLIWVPEKWVNVGNWKRLMMQPT